MAPARTSGGTRHHADFIQRFTEREAQRREVQQRNAPLIAEQRAARCRIAKDSLHQGRGRRTHTNQHC
ncbi:hypothetical protein L209DRAFT_365609 [Thermothelomyces heterothallicus CBS 203.75]